MDVPVVVLQNLHSKTEICDLWGWEAPNGELLGDDKMRLSFMMYGSSMSDLMSSC